MGSKQSKNPGEFPVTPSKNLTGAITVTTDYYDNTNNLDPRSPNICRTPLNEFSVNEDSYCTAANFNELSIEEPITPIQPQKSNSFKNKLLKGLKYSSNIFDPRSPSIFINRTPILFNENTINNDENNPADKSFNLNDTFSDLFIDLPDKNNEISKESTRIEETIIKEEEKLPIENDNKCDPRSPTVGVDRTPIIFNDDDAPDENLMIESVLETIKLNEIQKPQNKQLERIKNPPRRKTRSSARIAASVASNKMSVYKDCDIQFLSTPKKLLTSSGNDLNGDNNLKRTPLGCVANKSNLRSKSSETNNKKNNKIRPLINSFDDYNLKNLQKSFGNGENNENNSSMSNFIAKVN